MEVNVNRNWLPTFFKISFVWTFPLGCDVDMTCFEWLVVIKVCVCVCVLYILRC